MNAMRKCTRNNIKSAVYTCNDECEYYEVYRDERDAFEASHIETF